MSKKVKDIVYEYLLDKCKTNKDNDFKGLCAKEIAEALDMQRSNVSSVLNTLHTEGKVSKSTGRPVFFNINIEQIKQKNSLQTKSSFDILIGKDRSLKKPIQQAKAAILYPPKGLHTLLLGSTGVGKTMFAELMYRFAVENNVFSYDEPFVSFNCADYANNSQLLISHLFGCKKGAFTGANEDKVGIVEKANNGVLFLDEIHRLPPEGQEMLFYLLDRGKYTPLGDVKEKECNLLIICATTEDINSTLLDTFIRRIPMIINIPNLQHRSLEERFELICSFFKMESKRLGQKIEVTNNALRCLLLYDCIGNVGQLKSDIQLGCATAFLRYISSNEPILKVHSTDLSNYAKKGLLLYGKYENQVDKLINRESKLIFKEERIKEFADSDNYCIAENFYSSIEERHRDLAKRGLDDKDINTILSLDIENHFKKYIRKNQKKINKNQLAEIVGRDIVYLVDEFLKKVEEKTEKYFSENIFSSLCLHVSSTIERVKKNKKIVNYRLFEIRDRHPVEYELALDFLNVLSKEFKINIAEDEAGFITMFLCSDSPEEEVEAQKPIVVVAMHGKSAAASMVEVSEALIGAGNTYAYDMPLEKDTKVAYDELKEIIVNNHRGKGVMLLADMGTLAMYGDMISEETGIDIRVVSNVSTPLIMECSRKALIEYDLDNLYMEMQKISNVSNIYHNVDGKKEVNHKEPIIVTVCSTGQGGALQIKDIINKKLQRNKRYIKIINLSYNNKKQFYKKIDRLKENYNILFIVGNMDPKISSIKFLGVTKILSSEDWLKEIIYYINENSVYAQVIENLLRDMKFPVEFYTVNLFLDFTGEFCSYYKEIEYSKIIGLILHVLCAIDRLKNAKAPVRCEEKDELKREHLDEFVYIKNTLKVLENEYNIDFNDDEICLMIKIMNNI